MQQLGLSESNGLMPGTTPQRLMELRAQARHFMLPLRHERHYQPARRETMFG
ncbi:hypothetical protein ACE0DR_19920 [Azotobacter sp. CWF10]